MSGFYSDPLGGPELVRVALEAKKIGAQRRFHTEDLRRPGMVVLQAADAAAELREFAFRQGAAYAARTVRVEWELRATALAFPMPDDFTAEDRARTRGYVEGYEPRGYSPLGIQVVRSVR